MYILLFVIPVLVWVVVAKLVWHHHFSAKELIVQTIPTIIVIALIFSLSGMYQTYDTKIVNGSVTELNPKKESCPIGWVSYTDNHCTEYLTRTIKVGETCTTDSEGRRSCTPIYKTEYNYIYPWERRYFVYSDIDKTFEITRVDRQGNTFPPRFQEINIGDPVSKTERFTNYVRAASDSLFNVGEEEEVEVNSVPYPEIYDYYKVHRVINLSSMLDGETWKAWGEDLSVLNSDIKAYDANVIVVLTNDNVDFSNKLQRIWEGHNINDVIVTIGLNQSDIEWVDVKSWSSNSMVNVAIRDSIMELGTIEDYQAINSVIKAGIEENYKGQTEEDFSYLAEDIKPPMLTLVLAFLVLLVLTPLVTYIFVKEIDLK